MAEVAQTHKDRLKELKKLIEESRKYFKENEQRYERFMKFVFKSSLRDDEAATLAGIGKPTLEFNILESLISHRRGEFAKQEPSLTVRAADGVPLNMLTPQFTETIKVVEAHLREVLSNSSNDMLGYNVFSDLLGGGYSVLKIYTDYVDWKNFEQNIYIERVFDPTLTVFDPLARTSHKGDGRYCAELFPMTESEFIEEFGKEALEKMSFTRNLQGFDWSYENQTQKIILVCEFYEKKKKKETIVKLSNGHILTKREYDEFLKKWAEEEKIEQPPVIVSQRRTEIESIERYRFCETAVLDHTTTIYKKLPLIFVDGNSVNFRDSGTYKQMTRPYVYHAEGIQRLKNFAGQSLANELENTVQHKFIVSIESVPDEYLNAYENIQKADVLLYNHFLDTNNPTVTLPPPREVVRTPIPPQISDTFRMSDEMTQTILGSYDAAQGVASAQLSGIAFARSALQSNNAAIPYIVGYFKGWNRVAECFLDLMPLIYRTPRSLPILMPNGKRNYIEINKEGSIYMNYNPSHLQVKVEMGVNFAMQKEIALQTLISLSQSNKGFAEFFDEEGLPVLMDNIEIRGIDQLKEKAEKWMAQRQQQKQQMSQLAMVQQKMQMEQAQKELQSPTQTQIEAMAIQQQVRVEDANLAIKARDSEAKFLEILNKIQSEQLQNEMKAAEVEAENARTAVEAAIKLGAHINESLEKGMTHVQIDN